MAEKGTLELSFEAGQVLQTFGQTGKGGWGRKGIAQEKPRAWRSEAATARVWIKHC